MAKQIEGVSERILACARGEFLDKGFTGASLRTIAAAADTSRLPPRLYTAVSCCGVSGMAIPPLGFLPPQISRILPGPRF